MRHSLAATICFILALFGGLARAEDAILIIEHGNVELCVAADPPSQRLDPHALTDGSWIWASDRSSKGFGVQLLALPDGGVGISGHNNNLMLAYSRETQFASPDITLRGDPGQIEYGRKLLDEALAQVVPPVTQRAQSLGANVEGMQVTGLAYADLDEDGSPETVVEARSTPDFASSETAHPGQFAGMFVLSASGSPLGEIVQILGREDDDSRFQFRIAAIGRNPFSQTTSAHWDFLIEQVYERPSWNDETNTSVGFNQYRTIEVRTFDAGRFVDRPQLHRTTCSGADCPN